MTRYATFEVATPVGRAQRVGVLLAEGHLLDLTSAYALLLEERVDTSRVAALAAATLPPDLRVVLANGQLAQEALAQVRERFGGVPDRELRTAEGARVVYAVEDVRLLAPLPRPSSLRDASLYEEHFRKAFPGGKVPEAWYELPVYYKGNPAAVAGPGADIPMPPFAKRLDYEVEFAVVVGRAGRDLTEEGALGHIAGYTVFNDISARGVQMKESQLGLGPAKGKDFDGSNVLGPFLVTPDEFDPADGRDMVARVNGVEQSRARSDTMHHSIGRLLSHISSGETLHVGDVIGAGTVGGGSGAEAGVFLEVGDVVEVEVEGLGVLSNRVVASAAHAET